MSFAERLGKRPPMPFAAVKPTQSMPLAFCLPQVVTMEGNPVGLVNLVLSPLVVGGMESTRILTALEELLSLDHAALRSPERMEELREAASMIRRHLDSISAAAAQARDEHDATHDHDKELQ